MLTRPKSSLTTKPYHAESDRGGKKIKNLCVWIEILTNRSRSGESSSDEENKSPEEWEEDENRNRGARSAAASVPLSPLGCHCLFRRACKRRTGAFRNMINCVNRRMLVMWEREKERFCLNHEGIRWKNVENMWFARREAMCVSVRERWCPR